jgi:2-keto-4-pentenoate hydratase
MKMHTWKIVKAATFLLLAFTLAFGAGGVGAADTGAALAQQFLKKTPITALDPTMTLDQGAKAQVEFIAAITGEFGEPVGYKAGLTNPNVQKMFGVSAPIRGTMLKKMFLRNGAVVPADFACISVSEGDLVVRVGDEAVNQAKTGAEALKSLDVVFPFIELPDMVFGKGVKPSAAAIVAINVGARYGVLGDPIPLAATEEWQGRLKNFTLRMSDEKGAVVAEGKGTALLGDPLDVVLWIKNSLVAEGKKLKKGDLLSLGSLTKPIPAKPGVLKALYTGLDPKGPVEISVNFK